MIINNYSFWIENENYIYINICALNLLEFSKTRKKDANQPCLAEFSTN